MKLRVPFNCGVVVFQLTFVLVVFAALLIVLPFVLGSVARASARPNRKVWLGPRTPLREARRAR
jgi:hypothetical protein